MKAINPWINFNGNAEKAFAFYQSVFGGEFKKIVRFKDLASAEFPVPENEENKIMHIGSLYKYIVPGAGNYLNTLLNLFTALKILKTKK